MGDFAIGWRRQVSTEVRPWALDFQQELDQGDSLGSATSTLTDLATGMSYPAGLLGATSVSGTVATQSVQALVPGHNYRLVVLGSMGGSKLTAASLNLSVPY